MDQRTREYLAAHVAPLCATESSSPFSAVYCHNGLWWVGAKHAAVAAALGKAPEAQAYLASDVFAGAVDPSLGVQPLERDGLFATDRVMRLKALTGPRRKWRRSRHRREELLERCADGAVRVSDLVQRQATHWLDEDMCIDGAQLRTLLQLCPDYRPSVQRTTPDKPLAIVAAWRWTAVLMPGMPR